MRHYISWNDGRFGGEVFRITRATALKSYGAGRWIHDSKAAIKSHTYSYWRYSHEPLYRQPNGWSEQWQFAFILWPFAVLTGLSPALWLLMRLKPKKHGNFCAICGYDLRATPERCPECGTVPKPSAPS